MIRSRLPRILSLLVLLLLFLPAAWADIPVRVEAKTFGGHSYLIFYHPTRYLLDINQQRSLVKVSSSIPANFEIINPGQFNQLAGDLLINKLSGTATFRVKNLKFQSIINGEKLTAIKFSPEVVAQSPLPAATYQDPSSPRSIKYQQSQDQHQLVFDFTNPNVAMAAFFRGQYLWVIFDTIQKFSLKNSRIFSNLTQLENQKATILRIKVDNSYHARAIKTQARWQLIISKHHNGQPALVPEKLADNAGVIIKANFCNNQIVEFYDPEIGDLVKAIPLNALRRVSRPVIAGLDFRVIPSIQGVVVALNNEEVRILKSDNFIKILIDSDLPAQPSQDLRPAMPTEAELAAAKASIISLLPVLDRNLDIIDFNYHKSRLTLEASSATTKAELFNSRLALAKFLFIHEWFYEASEALNLSAKTTQAQYQADLPAQFVNAVASTMAGKIEAAKIIYRQLLTATKLPNADEVGLWNNYNQFLIGHHPDNIGWLNNLNVINRYPDNLYWPIALAEIDLKLSADDSTQAELIFKTLRLPPSGNFANSLNFYKAKYYCQKSQQNLAKSLFTALSQQEKDQFNRARSTIELVKLQLLTKDINKEQAIKTLNDLKFTWRGDQLEYDLLMLKANYYRDVNDNLQAFKTYKYIKNAFNNQISDFRLTAEMVKIFNKTFLPGGSIKNLSDFEAVALFYEFKDALPIGAEGDEVILSVVTRLVNLDLLEKAAELLQHQVKYRLTGQKRVTSADNLAIILLIDQKPLAALQVLDETDKDNFKFSDHLLRTRLRAKALIALKKYSDALAHLKADTHPEAIILKKECLFQAGMWQEYIDLVASEISQAKGADPKSVGSQDILRLAISYYNQNNHAALEDLATNFNLSGSLKDTVDLLLTSNAPIDYQNLDKSLQADQIQILLNKYKNQISAGQ